MFKVQEEIINNNYQGSNFLIENISIRILTIHEESMVKSMIFFEKLCLSVYRLDKLISLFPKKAKTFKSFQSEDQQATNNPLNLFIPNYTLQTNVKIPEIHINILDIEETHRKMQPYLKFFIQNTNIVISQNIIDLKQIQFETSFSAFISNISQRNPSKFEPFVEKLSCEITGNKTNSQKKLNINFVDAFLINLTPQCLEILLHFMRNLNKMKNSDKNDLGIDTLFSKSMKSFTFLNKTGRDLKLWFNDKKEDAWNLENNHEKFLEIELIFFF